MLERMDGLPFTPAPSSASPSPLAGCFPRCKRCDSGFSLGQSQSSQAVCLRSGQAGGAWSWCRQGKQDIRGLFSAKTGKLSPPSYCLLKLPCIKSAGQAGAAGMPCGLGLRAGNFSSTQVNTLPGWGLFLQSINLLFVSHLFPKRVSGLFPSQYSTRFVSENSWSLVEGTTFKFVNAWIVWPSNSLMESKKHLHVCTINVKICAYGHI